MQNPKSKIRNPNESKKSKSLIFFIICHLMIYLSFIICHLSFNMAPALAKSIEVDSTITAIEISGNHFIATDKIMEAVFSRTGDTLSQEKANVDVKAIYALGYFADVKVKFKPYLSGTKIVFEVTENPVVTAITFEGVSVYPLDKLRAGLATKIGEILSFKTLRDDIAGIDKRYHDDGYILERVVDVSNEVSGIIHIKLVEGVVENIALDGNDVTKDYVILRELRTRPGQPVNEKTLSKDLRRIFNLGFFQELTPNFEPGSAPDKIVLVIKIKEARTSSINFGGGYGEREGWFGFTDLSIDNLWGTAQGLLLKGQWGSQIQSYQFRYSQPWLMPSVFGDRTSYTLRLWDTLGQDIYYGVSPQNDHRIGWDMAFGKYLRDEVLSSLSFGSERVAPTGTSSFDAYRSDTIGISFSYDTRDFWMNPSEGDYYTLAIKEGLKTTSVTTSFTKYTLDLDRFFKLAEHQTLAFHGGTGVGFGDIPVDELFWVGGANTVRGYYPSEAHLGIKKLIFNAEYRYTFNDMFQGVLFYDYGDCWYDGGPNPNNFLSGRGFGIRLNTPMGPIRLDYGMGNGRTWGDGVLHFSIGHAF